MVKVAQTPTVTCPGAIFLQGEEPFNDPRDLPRAEHEVHLRKQLEQLIPVALREASCHDQSAAATDLLPLCHFQNRLQGLLRGRLYERAGVHDNEVRFIGLRNRKITGPMQTTQDDFAIYPIFRTSQADEMNPGFDVSHWPSIEVGGG
jgi:hypothetical protein